MNETNCGKICSECTYKEALNCPGCKAGPGKTYGATCELARCCRDKGHETCQTCAHITTCGTYRGRHRIPEYRQQRIQAEQQRRQALAVNAPILGKWLWFLFWLVIPSSIASIMTNKTVVEFAPSLMIPGAILQAVCTLAYGLILLRLSRIEDGYRIAGVCNLIAAALSCLTVLTVDNTGLTLLLSLPAAIASLVGIWYEYPAHADVLNDVDFETAEKWLALRKWHYITLGGTFGSLVVMLIIPLLGLLVLLASAIGALVVSISKLVNLYHTAQVFREWLK